MCEVFYQYNAGGLSYLAGRVFILMGCISLNSHPIQFRHVKSMSILLDLCFCNNYSLF
jgi:hypothetical protein